MLRGRLLKERTMESETKVTESKIEETKIEEPKIGDYKRSDSGVLLVFCEDGWHVSGGGKIPLEAPAFM